MHMHQLDTLYQSAETENSSGVKGSKGHFHKNVTTHSCYKARSKDPNMCISLRPFTYIMGSKGNLGSFGVTGIKF